MESESERVRLEARGKRLATAGCEDMLGKDGEMTPRRAFRGLGLRPQILRFRWRGMQDAGW